MGVRTLNEYRDFRNRSTSLALGALLITVKPARPQGLPPAPTDIDRSNIKESHEPTLAVSEVILSFLKRKSRRLQTKNLPMVFGELIIMVGTVGVAGGDTTKVRAETYFQVEHSSFCVTSGQAAFKTPDNSATLVPTVMATLGPGVSTTEVESADHCWQDVESLS